MINKRRYIRGLGRVVPPEISNIKHWSLEEKMLIHEAAINIRDNHVSIYSEVQRLFNSDPPLLPGRSWEAIRWQIDKVRRKRQKKCTTSSHS